MIDTWKKHNLYSIDRSSLKFTDTIDDSWFLRTVFVGNSESVASYKHWFLHDRRVRGSYVKYETDYKFCFEL